MLRYPELSVGLQGELRRGYGQIRSSNIAGIAESDLLLIGT